MKSIKGRSKEFLFSFFFVAAFFFALAHVYFFVILFWPKRVSSSRFASPSYSSFGRVACIKEQPNYCFYRLGFFFFFLMYKSLLGRSNYLPRDVCSLILDDVVASSRAKERWRFWSFHSLIYILGYFLGKLKYGDVSLGVRYNNYIFLWDALWRKMQESKRLE